MAQTLEVLVAFPPGTRDLAAGLAEHELLAVCRVEQGAGQRQGGHGVVAGVVGSAVAGGLGFQVRPVVAAELEQGKAAGGCAGGRGGDVLGDVADVCP